MRLLISGYRNFYDKEVIGREINKLKNVDVIIHGGCSGVDTVSDEIAREKRIDLEIYRPNWNLGKIAGPIRNELMITAGKPDYALLFLSKNSKGTKNMLELVKKYQIPFNCIEVD